MYYFLGRKENIEMNPKLIRKKREENWKNCKGQLAHKEKKKSKITNKTKKKNKHYAMRK